MKLTIASVLLLALFACSSPSKTRVTPGETDVRSEHRETPPTRAVENRTRTYPDGSIEYTQRVENSDGAATSIESAKAKGAGIDTTADKLEQGFTGQASDVGLSGGTTGRAGGSNSKTKAEMFDTKTALPLLIIGALAIVAGIVVGLLLKQVILGVGIGAGGVFLIAAGLFPALTLTLVIVGGAIGAGFLVWHSVLSAKTKSALAAHVSGLINAPHDAAAAVKAEIEKQATPADKVTIAAVAAKEKL